MSNRQRAPRYTRGERNNNPGNIEKTDIRWIGEARGFDPRFETFETPYHGIRALVVLLRTYWKRRRLRTVEAIILRYAPEGENDSRAYINHVCKQLNVEPLDPLDLTHAARMRELVCAIILYENGRILDSYEPLITQAVAREVV